MLTTGPNLGLLDGGDYGEANYHELLRTLRALDLLVQPRVKSATTDIATIVAPVEGDAYIVPAAATGVWADQVGKLARYTERAAASIYTAETEGWEFFAPKKGWIVGVDDTDSHMKFNGTTWVAFGGA